MVIKSPGYAWRLFLYSHFYVLDNSPTLEQKIAVYNYLKTYLTPEKVDLFEKVSNSRTRYLSVVLEDVFQSHNSNAVLRNCDCFGIQDVHVIENRNLFETHPRISRGALKWLNLFKYSKEENNTLQCIKTLKNKGYRIIATSPHINDIPLEELDVEQKTALIFGTELSGISEDVKSHADAFVYIPTSGFSESLNLSVSVAVCLNDLTNKLKKSDINWKLTEEEKIDLKLHWAKMSIKKCDLLIKHFKEKQLG